MPEFLNRISGQLTELWNKFTTRQKIQIIATMSIAVIALVVLVVFLNKPNFIILEEDIEPKDVNAITEQLTDADVAFQVGPDARSVLVQAADKTKAIQALAAVGIVSTDGMTYAELFNNSIMTSDSEKALKAQEFFQAELGRKIELIDMIENASVTLVIPEADRTIFDDTADSKASIILTSFEDLKPELVENVAKFVATAVVNLDLADITVIDSNARLLFDGSVSSGTIGGVSGADYELQQELVVKNRVRSILLAAGAYDDAIVSVDLVIDYDQLEKVSEVKSTQDGTTTGIIDTESTYIEESVNTESGGTPGTDSNGVTDTLVDGGGESTSTIEEINRDYVYNTEVTTSIKAIGAVEYENSTIAVSLSKYKYYDQEILEAQENGLLADQTWEQFKFSIIEQGNKKVESVDPDIISLVSNASKINNVVVLAYEVPRFIPKKIEESAASDYVLIGIIVIMILLLGYAVYKGTEPVEIKEIEPELSVEDLLTSTKQGADLDAIEFGGKSDARVQIEQFVENNPDAVALLLRNWLNEDWE